MFDVQDIFAAYADEYRQNHKLSIVQHKAMNAIMNCRTSRLGGHMDTCPTCGDTRISYNSCRNRHCPKCLTLSKERWIDARKADLLNVGYFHVVFTLPQELNSTIYAHQKELYSLLFRCVSETLQELSADKKYLGASIGLTAVLHTWGQNLCFHPHIHCIVPASGLNALGRWVHSKKKFLLPVKVLSRKFRGKFLALLKQQKSDISQDLLNTCYKRNGLSIANHLLKMPLALWNISVATPTVSPSPTTGCLNWKMSKLPSSGVITRIVAAGKKCRSRQKSLSAGF